MPSSQFLEIVNLIKLIKSTCVFVVWLWDRDKKRGRDRVLLALIEGWGRRFFAVVVSKESVEAVSHHLLRRRHHFRLLLFLYRHLVYMIRSYLIANLGFYRMNESKRPLYRRERIWCQKAEIIENSTEKKAEKRNAFFPLCFLMSMEHRFEVPPPNKFNRGSGIQPTSSLTWWKWEKCFVFFGQCEKKC